jgi:spore coat protein CotH
MVHFSNNIKYLFLLVVFIAVFSCEKEALIIPGQNLSDWSEESHSMNAEPDYAIVFNQEQVLRLDIVIEAEYWQAMQADISDIINNIPERPQKKSASTETAVADDENPIYVPCQVFFNGKQWYDVGIRYKGNSSLNSALSMGIKKLPFRLEFNHFEDENPNIFGQSFYGFKQLSLANNFKDNSFIHEKVATDVYRDFGIPAPMSAFYRIYVDYGEGAVYFGLYTMLEVVFDGPMLQKQFGNVSGNCYKPEGSGAQLNNISLVNSVFFSNKTNPDSDLSDAQALVSILLSDSRKQNPEQWRQDLESVFNVELFLKWLAANTTMQNWDTYGQMSHNYYLYHNVANNLLTWIPWDNNETFADRVLPQSQESGVLEFDFSNLPTEPQESDGTPPWPLISYIYDDLVYRSMYEQSIDEFIQGSFLPSTMKDRFEKAHNLVKPYVIGEVGEVEGYSFLSNSSEFELSLDELISFVERRKTEAENYTP